MSDEPTVTVVVSTPERLVLCQCPCKCGRSVEKHLEHHQRPLCEICQGNIECIEMIVRWTFAQGDWFRKRGRR